MLLKPIALGCLVLSLTACGHTDKPTTQPTHKPSPSNTYDKSHYTPTPEKTYSGLKYVDTDDYNPNYKSQEGRLTLDVASTYSYRRDYVPVIMPGTWTLAARSLGKGCEWKLTREATYPDYEPIIVGGGFVMPGEQTTLQIKHQSRGDDTLYLTGRCEMKWAGV